MRMLFLSFCFVLIASPGMAQQSDKTTVFPFGVIEKIHSQELNEERTLNIYLPEHYHPDSALTYPIIYLLDASANEDYPHIAGLVQFLVMFNLMPPSIVVGIANVDRQRDFTSPTSVEEEKKKLPTSGGSAAFIRFLEKDLKPYIEKKYKTNGTNTLIGQSLGGLLATQVLFESPQLFQQYIIISPSLWWNKGAMLNQASTLLNNKKQAGKKIYIGVGNERKDMVTDAKVLEKNIKKYCGNACTVFHQYFPHETHATILHRSVYQAIEWLYPIKK